MIEFDLEKFSEEVKERGDNLRDIEKKTSISISTLSRYFRGEHSMRVDHFIVLCKTYGLNPCNYFMCAHDFIQIQNPVTKKWMKVSRIDGRIVQHSQSEKPYPGITKYKSKME